MHMILSGNLTDVLNIENGCVNMKEFSLKIPSFNLLADCHFVEGPNGSGKSTFLKVVLGITLLSTGEIKKKAGMSFGYVPQNYRATLIPWLSAKENVCLFSKSEEVVEQLLAIGFPKVDLEKKPFALSGGQCQRISIVRECSVRRDILVLDEPFSGVDIQTVPKLGNLLQVQSAKGTKLILTSHTQIPKIIQQIPSFSLVSIRRITDDSAVLEVLK